MVTSAAVVFNYRLCIRMYIMLDIEFHTEDFKLGVFDVSPHLTGLPNKTYAPYCDFRFKLGQQMEFGQINPS